ncbi:hypothetical protein Q1695_009148 [Nippostrongylus brasiliensis]|nr:hypothetical protein Q1695_009148 [Nippostrongylus brasiliensis]
MPKDFLSGKINEEVRHALDKFEKKFNTTALTTFREELAGLEDKIKANLNLTKEELAEVTARVKLVKRTKVDQVQPVGDSIDDINLNVGIGVALYQGDIVLTKEQSEEILDQIREVGNRSKRQAFRDRNYPMTIWPNREVPYFFDLNAGPSTRSVFSKAAKLWAKDTCIDIYEDEFAEESIRVFEQDGCWSYVGKLQGTQDLSLGQGCDSIGTAAHELGHALGFFHTHSRHDRNDYITVMTSNIKEDWLDQFTLETEATNDNYGLPYDYGSVMQYGATSASDDKVHKSLTMVPKDIKYTETLGSPFISFIDLLMMNMHYSCTDDCEPRTSAKCHNNGFVHPRDCQKCICPGGYGGDFCDERPKGCGQTLIATPQPQVFVDEVGNRDAGTTPREDFDMCYYWIKAPEGKRIKVKLLQFQPEGIAVDGCVYAGVEFKWQKDQMLSGPRYCSSQDAGTELISSSHLMPIITYNRMYASVAVIQYSFV